MCMLFCILLQHNFGSANKSYRRRQKKVNVFAPSIWKALCCPCLLVHFCCACMHFKLICWVHFADVSKIRSYIVTHRLPSRIDSFVLLLTSVHYCCYSISSMFCDCSLTKSGKAVLSTLPRTCYGPSYESPMLLCRPSGGSYVPGNRHSFPFRWIGMWWKHHPFY